MPSNDTTFVSKSTVIIAPWAQSVNDFVFKGRNPNYVTSTGTSTAYVVTLPAPSLYASKSAGDTFTWVAHVANASSPTLAVNGTAAQALVDASGVALTTGKIPLGAIVTVVNTGTTYQVTGTLGDFDIEYNVMDYGATGLGTDDDSAAINAAITACGTASGGIVRFPPGTFWVASTIECMYSNVFIRGEGVGSSIIVGDIGLTCVVKFGDAGTVLAVYNGGISDLTVTRDVGTVTSGKIGILYSLFNYLQESNVQVCRQDTGRWVTGNAGGGISLGLDLLNPWSYDCKSQYLVLENVAQVRAIGGEFGRNGGEIFDTAAVMLITGDCNDVCFDHTVFIPRTPSVGVTT